MARMRLTAAAVQRIKAPASVRVEYWDAILPGFGLRVTENGVKSWFMMYRVDGRRRRYTLGTYPKVSLAKARERAQTAFDRIDEGGDPAGEKTDRRRARLDTVEGVVDLFIERYAKRKNRTWKQTEALFKSHVLPFWGKRDIATIRKRDVIELLDEAVSV